MVPVVVSLNLNGLIRCTAVGILIRCTNPVEEVGKQIKFFYFYRSSAFRLNSVRSQGNEKLIRRKIHTQTILSPETILYLYGQRQ